MDGHIESILQPTTPYNLTIPLRERGYPPPFPVHMRFLRALLVSFSLSRASTRCCGAAISSSRLWGTPRRRRRRASSGSAWGTTPSTRAGAWDDGSVASGTPSPLRKGVSRARAALCATRWTGMRFESSPPSCGLMLLGLKCRQYDHDLENHLVSASYHFPLSYHLQNLHCLL